MFFYNYKDNYEENTYKLQMIIRKGGLKRIN